VLTDLGLARLVTAEHLTQTGMSVGTPAYTSPEQALGEETDALPPPRPVRAEVPEALERVILRALERDPGGALPDGRRAGRGAERCPAAGHSDDGRWGNRLGDCSRPPVLPLSRRPRPGPSSCMTMRWQAAGRTGHTTINQ
jgi:serine/threonine-protein kinase